MKQWCPLLKFIKLRKEHSGLNANTFSQALMKSNAKAAAPMMRNGVTGEGSKVFSERQHNLFNEIFREKMAGTGFDVYSY